jgi:hypothetical protein
LGNHRDTEGTEKKAHQRKCLSGLLLHGSDDIWILSFAGGVPSKLILQLTVAVAFDENIGASGKQREGNA